MLLFWKALLAATVISEQGSCILKWFQLVTPTDRANDLQGLPTDFNYKQDTALCPQCCGRSAPCSGTLKHGRMWLFYPRKDVSFKQKSEYIHSPLKLTISLNLEPRFPWRA